MVPARTTQEAYRNCDAETPLRPGNPAYVDLFKARGQHQTFSKRVSFVVENSTTDGDATHIGLISGHRGCGKSTELLRVRGDLEARGWAVAYFDAFAVLDQNDLEAPDLMIALCENVAELAAQDGEGFDERTLELVYDYLAKEEILKEEKNLAEVGVEGGAELGGGISGLLKLFVKLRTNIKGSEESRKTYRRVIEKDFSNFSARLRTLVQSAEAALQRAGKKGLVVIVDSLEKLPYVVSGDGKSSHERFFQLQAPILKCPPCRVFYTVPITLTAEELLSNTYGDPPLIVPMINLRLPEAHECFCELLKKRVDFGQVFEPGVDLDGIVKASGGCVRDLLRLVRQAVLAQEAPVAAEQIDYAIGTLVKEYGRLFADADIPAIVDCLQEKWIDYDETGRKLLYRRVVLEYENGEQWMEPHPLVQRNARIVEALNPKPPSAVGFGGAHGVPN